MSSLIIDTNQTEEALDTRENIKIDKGIILTSKRVEKNYELYTKYLTFFSAYPDLFIDLITPRESNFHLFPYQRIFLRACLRYRYHYCVAPRAFSKSFLSILAKYLTCMFLPGSKQFICAPGKDQGTKIARENISTIWTNYPLLKKELVGDGEPGTSGINFGADTVRLTFKNGSVFDIVAAQDAQRGGRRSGGIIDEVRDHDGDMLNAIVIPLMNVNRRTAGGLSNPKEPHQAQTYITSAGNKSTYAYERMMELLIFSVISPDMAFVWGCDYRVPVMYGLITKNYVREQRLSATYKEDDFAREYLSIWIGGSADSWINYDMMSKYRVIVNAEKKQNLRENSESFYIMSVDVGRLVAQTVVSVIKVNIENERYISRLVNMEVIPDTMHFEHQCARIKEIYFAFKPREMVVDGTGLGVGLMDFMIQYSRHDITGEVLPPLGSFNDKDYLAKQPRDCEKPIYVLKADPTVNGAVYANLYSTIATGKVLFLITEQEAKTRLVRKKVGQMMNEEEKIKKLKPYKIVSILQEELANLRIKDGSVNQKNISVEQINRKIGKDKVSSLAYGLYRVKHFEEEYQKKRTRSKRDIASIMQFTRGGAKRARE